MTQANFLVVDPGEEISPRIEHKVDEIRDERGRLEQLYNYVDYQFERDAVYLRARMYIDKPRVVDLFGPYRTDGVEAVRAPELEEAARGYLGRRFNKVRSVGTHEP